MFTPGYFFARLKRKVIWLAQTNLRAAFLLGLVESQAETIAIARDEARFTMREWALHWQRTGDPDAIENAIRFRTIARTMDAIIEAITEK